MMRRKSEPGALGHTWPARSSQGARRLQTVAVAEDDVPGGLVGLQEIKERCGGLVVLALAEKCGILSYRRVQLFRHAPVGTFNLAVLERLRQGDEAQRGVAGGDELVGLGNVFTRDQL